MSKIGQKPIEIPSTVTVEIKNNIVNVKGPVGEERIILPTDFKIIKTDEVLVLKRPDDEKKSKSLHGLWRQLVYNAIQGVVTVWEKRLEVVGTGYTVKLQGEDLVLKVGYSHPIVFKKVPTTTYTVEGNNKIIVQGSNKQLVGQVAYQIKLIKKPDAYKGKGIRYVGEQVKLKPVKKAKTATA